MQTFSITDGPIDAETHVVEPRGEIDLATAGILKTCLEGALAADKRHVIVDLEDVDFIDSTGLGVLLSVERRLQAGGGTLIVACPNEGVRKVFEITGLDQVLSLQASRKDALLLAQSFAPTAG
ncbi:MAG: anti-sigma factor antagonist [Thermoleophilaceae bacterium]|nr:anti-sigma factor antagonist [Thermoleophilaceae bacterium]